MLRLFRKKKKQKKEEEINLQKNGSLLLEELIATSGGIYNPIRTFSSDQILQATNHFDWNYVISEDRFVWYKGMIENRPVLIKKFQDCSVFDADNFYRDIAVSSLMSSHKNVLKLLGCCLEFPRPVLVCEYPEGETGVNDMVCRTSSYIEPDYFNTGLVTENVDIYSLGIIMLIILTGKSEYNSEVAVYLPVLPVYVGKFLERGLLTELIDPSILDSTSDDIPKHSRLQMEAFIELAFRCVRFRPGENVPRMIDVAKELKKIEKHI